MSTQRIGATVPPNNRLPTGYEGQNVPDDFNIPPVGIEDVDRAMFELFDKQVPLYVTRKGKTEKVPVVFAAGERFAVRARKEPIRDENGQFVLPMMSISRKNISQDKMFMNGRGMGIDTGDLVIKKRLHPNDRRYQNLLNKLGIKNQANVASKENYIDSSNRIGSIPGSVASRREKINKSTDELLANKTGQNIFEIITMPFPEFFTATYEITVWAQFQQHMNQIIERIWANYNPNQKSFKLETPKGYWFVAYFEDEITNEDNTDEFPNEERMIKETFRVNVPAYHIASRNDGDPVPFRSFLSAPQISFGIYSSDDEIITDSTDSSNPSGDIDKFTLNDVTLLDKQGKPKTGRTAQSYKAEVIVDPISGKQSIRYVRIISKNTRIGETVIGAEYIDDVDVVLGK